MAFIAIMARKPRATLLQHDDIYDEEGWRILIRIWKVPVSRTSPDGIDYSLSLLSPDGDRIEWWGTITTGPKVTIVMSWPRKVRMLTGGH